MPSNQEIAIETRTKFEFYLLALIFTILGVSVQTAKFGQLLFADACELVAWLALAFSGVVGLLRAEWIPVAYEIFSKIQSTETHIEQLKQVQEQGVEHMTTFEDGDQVVQLNPEQAIEKLQATLANIKGQLIAAEKRIRDRYWWMKWLFVAGIGCLLFSRGIVPAISVFNRVTDCYDGPLRAVIC